MTNLSNSSLKLILLHGLNNNLDCFFPLRDALNERGFDCVLVTLPGHGDDRDLGRNLSSAIEDLDRQLQPHLQEPYYVVGFSMGALLFQVWLEEKKRLPPKSQILLAPALKIKRMKIVSALMRLLPGSLPLKSFMPEHGRRRSALYVWEYRTLIEGILAFKDRFLAPTLILIDPKDELVDAQALKRLHSNTVFVERPQLKGAGHHHLLFHPDYFTPEQWKDFLAFFASHP
jgi:pimeloyl-ACP methyl ester carboxylesterase